MRRLGTVLACVSAFGAAAAPVSAQGIDETCLLVLTRFDAGTVNVAFPDDSAMYWVGVYQALPGTRIRLAGRFPHTRYMSFNVYDQLQRPLDALADVDLVPDAGSTNPFVAGADRTAADRDYTAFIDFAPTPAQRAPNTLYTGTGQGGTPNYNGTFIYRTYIPDQGLDPTGGVGIPTATIEPVSATSQPTSPCTTLVKPSVTGINELYASLEGFPSGGTLPPLFDRPVPKWRKFSNLFASVADSLTDSDTLDPLFELQRSLDLAQRGGSGGFLSNVHNAYLSAGINKAYGGIVVTRMKMPTFPDTRPPALTMPTGQLRYWSMCANDPLTQRFTGCVNDDRAAVGADGYATFVVSTPANRPSNARKDCGINWLPWGPNARNVLIYRHMLPDPGFPQSIQRATVENEIATMGEYFPSSQYRTRLQVELLGCS